MKKQKNIIEGMAKQVIKKIVDQEIYEWPPRCPSFYYQPLRPQNESKQKKESRKK